MAVMVKKEGDIISIAKYRITYTEQGRQGKMQIYTYDITVYLKNLIARHRGQLEIVNYELV